MDKAIDLTPILPSDKNKTTYQIISPQVEKVSKYDTKYAKYVLKTEKPTIHIFNVDGQVLNFDGENKDIQEINIHSGVKQIVLHNIIACDKLSNAPTPYLPQLTLHNVGHKTEPSE
ncbi:hypothetical protein FACS1894166_09860 [Bacilli bacterium]|nr:hypothetical protein FACS1894166_09860 [Bacilli bacterium]